MTTKQSEMSINEHMHKGYHIQTNACCLVVQRIKAMRYHLVASFKDHVFDLFETLLEGK